MDNICDYEMIVKKDSCWIRCKQNGNVYYAGRDSEQASQILDILCEYDV